jgi:hypothetical protein
MKCNLCCRALKFHCHEYDTHWASYRKRVHLRRRRILLLLYVKHSKALPRTLIEELVRFVYLYFIVDQICSFNSFSRISLILSFPTAADESSSSNPQESRLSVATGASEDTAPVICPESRSENWFHKLS